MKRVLAILCVTTVVLTACVSSQPPAAPGDQAAAGGMQASPQFAKWGLKVVSCSPLDGAPDVEIVLASSQNLILGYEVLDASRTAPGTRTIYTINRAADGQWTLTTVFPASGAYTLMLYGRLSSQSDYTLLAGWQARAEVSAESSQYVRFGRYGLNVVSASPLAGGADLEIVLASPKDLSLAWGLVNTTAGEKNASSLWSVPAPVNGQYTVTARFPRSAEYRLELYGWAKGEKEDYAHPIACWNASGVVPGDVVVFSRFNRYGLKVDSVSPMKNAADAEISLSSTQDLELFYGTINKTAGEKDVQSLAYMDRPKAGSWSLQTIFPRSGEYQVVIWGRMKGQQDSTPLAAWSFQADVPSDAVTYSRFARYGLKVDSATPMDGVTDAEVVLSSPQDLELFYNLQDNAHPEKYRSYSGLPSDNGKWRIPMCFTESGSYELSVEGKASTETGYRYFQLGRWNIRAEVPNGSVTYSYFNVDGLKVVSPAVQPGAAEAQVVLTSPKDLALVAFLYDKATKKAVGGSAMAKTPGKWTIAVMFPKTGDYELRVSEWRPSQQPDGSTITTPYMVGRWAFNATVDPASSLYLFGMNQAIRRVRMASDALLPDAEDTLWQHEARKGTLAENLDLPFFSGAVSVKKGSEIRFWNQDREIDQIAYALPAATMLKVRDSVLQCPKGAQLTFMPYAGDQVDVDLGQEATFTVHKQALRCAGTVHFFTQDEGFDLALAADTPMAFGKTRLVIPAKSQVNFAGAAQRVTSVLLAADLTVPFNGESKKVAAGWLVTFDDKGAVTDIRDNGYYAHSLL